MVLKSRLIEVLGSDNVLFKPVDLMVYECDGETLDKARPDLVVLPGCTNEVQEVIKIAKEFNVFFTPRGAGTGLSGGSTTVKGGICLSLSRMNKVIEIDPENMVATVQVGVTNLAVSNAAGKYNLYFAPDPSSQFACTIGGNVAENAGGAHTLKQGLTVDHVLGLTIVLPDGSTTTFGGKAHDCLGLDLLGLFIGSEGTLGIATEAILKLTPVAPSVETILAYFPTLEDGGNAVSEIVSTGVIPSAMEMIDQLTLSCVEDSLHLGLNTEAAALIIVELDGIATAIKEELAIVQACLEKHNSFGIKIAGSKEERAAIWKARKGSFASLGRIAPHAYVLDGVVPRSKLALAINKISAIGKEYNLTIANVYHAGDGNLHPALLFNRDNSDEVRRVMQAAEKILLLCVELGGTLSGEHGIGIEKLQEMPQVFSQAELASMRLIKECFDKDGLCNPGKLVPMPKGCGEAGWRPLLRHQLSTSAAI